MLKTTFVILLFSTLPACEKNREEQSRQSTHAQPPLTTINSDADDVSYIRMVKIEEHVEDSSYDLGYWETSLTYPQLTEKISAEVRDPVNEQIVNLVNRYQCSDKGDHSFTATIRYTTPYLLSFSYEAMNMCTTSGRISSDEGAYTVNLATGEEILIDREFNDDDVRKQFEKIVKEKLQKFMQRNSNVDTTECPSQDKFDYYFANQNSLTFGSRSTDHYYSFCNIHIQIPKTEMSQFLRKDSILLR